MSPLVNGIDVAIATIAGYADRVHTDESHSAKLQREAAVSYTRATNAEDTILAKFSEWLDPAPASWDQLPQIATFYFGNGAVGLVVEPASEADRRRNRRVQIEVCRFIADGKA
jgi:hypothetical protein